MLKSHFRYVLIFATANTVQSGAARISIAFPIKCDFSGF